MSKINDDKSQNNNSNLENNILPGFEDDYNQSLAQPSNGSQVNTSMSSKIPYGNNISFVDNS